MNGKELKFREIIRNIIEEIEDAKRRSERIHKAGDIRDSGDEVENIIREKISLFLPERYLVKQGHIVNSSGKVSNQFDIIIFDRLNTPKFFESQNDTVYYPIESVLAVGEIKKTLKDNHLTEFRKKIKYLKVEMERKLIENTVYGGEISGNASFFDIVNMPTNRKYKNPLFSFLFAVEAKNFSNLYLDDEFNYLPNDIYALNLGSFIYGTLEKDTINNKIKDEDPYMNTWIDIQKPGINCLALMFNQLINHLNRCHIEPFSITNYMSSKEDFGILGSEVKMYTMEKNK